MGSATTVANKGIKLQSVGVAVRYHALTKYHIPVDQSKVIEAPKRKTKSLILEIVDALSFYRVLWLKRHI